MPRTHKILGGDGWVEVECTAGGDPMRDDCPQCKQERIDEITTWIKRSSKICVICNENPKCYICLKKNCEDWGNKATMEEYGTDRGCPKLVASQFCSDFNCRWGLVGWWVKDWRGKNAKRKRKIGRMVHREFYERYKASKKKKRKIAKRVQKKKK